VHAEQQLCGTCCMISIFASRTTSSMRHGPRASSAAGPRSLGVLPLAHAAACRTRPEHRRWSAAVTGSVALRKRQRQCQRGPKSQGAGPVLCSCCRCACPSSARRPRSAAPAAQLFSHGGRPAQSGARPADHGHGNRLQRVHGPGRGAILTTRRRMPAAMTARRRSRWSRNQTDGVRYFIVWTSGLALDSLIAAIRSARTRWTSGVLLHHLRPAPGLQVPSDRSSCPRRRPRWRRGADASRQHSTGIHSLEASTRSCLLQPRPCLSSDAQTAHRKHAHTRLRQIERCPVPRASDSRFEI